MRHHAPIAAADRGRCRGRADAVRPRARLAVTAGAHSRGDRGRRLARTSSAGLLGEKIRRAARAVVRDREQYPGAGIIAEQLANKSPPDGHTMMMLTAGYAGRAALHQGLAFDPLDGFAFVTGVCGYPMVYSVAPKSPIKSFTDMLERAKAKPDMRSPIPSMRRARSITC